MEDTTNPSQGVSMLDTVLASSLEKPVSHGKREDKARGNGKSQPAGMHEEEDFGSERRSRDPCEKQGPLDLGGTAPSLWSLATISCI